MFDDRKDRKQLCCILRLQFSGIKTTQAVKVDVQATRSKQARDKRTQVQIEENDLLVNLKYTEELI